MSLRKSSRARRLSEKALNWDDKDHFINNVLKPQVVSNGEPLLKKRKLSSNGTAEDKTSVETVEKSSTLSNTNNDNDSVTNFQLINLRIVNPNEEEEMLFNNDFDQLHTSLSTDSNVDGHNTRNQNHTKHQIDEDYELKQTELRLSLLVQDANNKGNSKTEVVSSPKSEISIPIEPCYSDTTSLEEFLQYDLMPSLTDDDLASGSSSPLTDDSAVFCDYLPFQKRFEYRLNDENFNLSLSLKNNSNFLGNNGTLASNKNIFINLIKKRATDVFLNDGGMFNMF